MRLTIGFSVSAVLVVAICYFAPKWPLMFEAIYLDELLGQEVSEVPQAGYAANMFGSFERVDTRDHLISVQRRLVEVEPSAREFRFSLAGSLMRALKLSEAEELYRALIAEDPENATSTQLMLANVLWLKGDSAGANEALERANKSYRRQGIPNIVATPEQAFKGLRRGT